MLLPPLLSCEYCFQLSHSSSESAESASCSQEISRVGYHRICHSVRRTLHRRVGDRHILVHRVREAAEVIIGASLDFACLFCSVPAAFSMVLTLAKQDWPFLVLAGTCLIRFERRYFRWRSCLTRRSSAGRRTQRYLIPLKDPNKGFVPLQVTSSCDTKLRSICVHSRDCRRAQQTLSEGTLLLSLRLRKIASQKIPPASRVRHVFLIPSCPKLNTHRSVRINFVAHNLEACLEVCSEVQFPLCADRFLASIGSRETHAMPQGHGDRQNPSNTTSHRLARSRLGEHLSV